MAVSLTVVRRSPGRTPARAAGLRGETLSTVMALSTFSNERPVTASSPRSNALRRSQSSREKNRLCGSSACRTPSIAARTICA